MRGPPDVRTAPGKGAAQQARTWTGQAHDSTSDRQPLCDGCGARSAVTVVQDSPDDAAGFRLCVTCYVGGCTAPDWKAVRAVINARGDRIQRERDAEHAPRGERMARR